MDKIQEQIFLWAVEHWDILTKRASHYSKKDVRVPVSVQLERRFHVGPLDRLALTTSIYMNTVGRR